MSVQSQTANTAQALDKNKRYIKSAELARRLGLRRNTIEHWRRRKHGPAFVRIGQCIYYDEAVVDAWIDQHTHACTAEYEPHQQPPRRPAEVAA